MISWTKLNEKIYKQTGPFQGLGADKLSFGPSLLDKKLKCRTDQRPVMSTLDQQADRSDVCLIGRDVNRLFVVCCSSYG